MRDVHDVRHRIERDALDVGDPARAVKRLVAALGGVGGRVLVVQPGQAGAALEVVLEGVVQARDDLGESGVDLRGLRLTARGHCLHRTIVPMIRAAARAQLRPRCFMTQPRR